MNNEFIALGLREDIAEILEKLALDAPTDIQRQVIPEALAGRNCLAQAYPGAGKTNAYILPILQRCEPNRLLQAIVIQPTRSLAQRLDRNMAKYAEPLGLRSALAVTHRSRGRREEEDLGATEIVVGTPQGIATLLDRDKIDADTVRTLVIDELDVILESEDRYDLMELLEALNESTQRIVIATELSDAVENFVQRYIPEAARAGIESALSRAAEARQGYFRVEPDDRFETLVTYCKRVRPKLAVVFTESLASARELAKGLAQKRIEARLIDDRGRGGRSSGPPGRRSDVVVAFDPPGVALTTIPASHLIHYDVPSDVDAFLLRIKRCARLSTRGLSVAFVDPADEWVLQKIETALGREFEALDMPERADRPPGREGPPRGRSNEGDGKPRGDGDEPHRREGRGRGRREGESDREPRGRGGDRRGGGGGERRGGGGRGGRRREGSGGGETLSREAPPKPAKPATNRLAEVIRRDAEFDARGLTPLPRTLGSRFRSARPRRSIKNR